MKNKFNLYVLLISLMLFSLNSIKAKPLDDKNSFATITKARSEAINSDYVMGLKNDGINITETIIISDSQEIEHDTDYIFNFDFDGTSILEESFTVQDDPDQASQDITNEPRDLNYTQENNADKMLLGLFKEIVLGSPPFRRPFLGAKVYVFPNDSAIMILPNGTNIHFTKVDGKSQITNLIPANIISEETKDNGDRELKIKGLKGEPDCTVLFFRDEIGQIDPEMAELDDIADKLNEKIKHAKSKVFKTRSRISKFNSFDINARAKRRINNNQVTIDGKIAINKLSETQFLEVIFSQDFEKSVKNSLITTPAEAIYIDIEQEIVRPLDFQASKSSKTKKKGSKVSMTSKGSFTVPGTSEELFNFSTKVSANSSNIFKGRFRVTLDSEVTGFEDYAEALGIPADGKPHDIDVGTGSFQKFNDSNSTTIFEHNFIDNDNSTLTQAWTHFKHGDDKLIGLGEFNPPDGDFILFSSVVDTSELTNITGQTMFKCTPTTRTSSLFGNDDQVATSFNENSNKGRFTVTILDGDTFQELELGGGGLTVEGSGCVVNVITKSGGNSFSATVNVDIPE